MSLCTGRAAPATGDYRPPEVTGWELALVSDTIRDGGAATTNKLV